MPSSCASVAPALWKMRPSPSTSTPGMPKENRCAVDCGSEACIASIEMRSLPVPAKTEAGSMPSETLMPEFGTRRSSISLTSQSAEARLAGCALMRK